MLSKITEIRETYTATVRGKDGKLSRQEAQRFRDIPLVTGWPRFGHALLDAVFFLLFYFLFYVTLIFIASLTGITGGVVDHITRYETLYNLVLVHPGFYLIFEIGLQGSPAKAILGRVVVDEYGNKAGIKQLVIRSWSRSVPFEALSCLNERGWHDVWSKTYVIRKKDLEELKMLQKISDIEPITANEGNDSNRQDAGERRPS